MIAEMPRRKPTVEKKVQISARVREKNLDKLERIGGTFEVPPSTSEMIDLAIAEYVERHVDKLLPRPAK
jgi:hypothetical protein